MPLTFGRLADSRRPPSVFHLRDLDTGHAICRRKKLIGSRTAHVSLAAAPHSLLGSHPLRDYQCIGVLKRRSTAARPLKLIISTHWNKWTFPCRYPPQAQLPSPGK